MYACRDSSKYIKEKDLKFSQFPSSTEEVDRVEETVLRTDVCSPLSLPVPQWYPLSTTHDQTNALPPTIFPPALLWLLTSCISLSPAALRNELPAPLPLVTLLGGCSL